MNGAASRKRAAARRGTRRRAWSTEASFDFAQVQVNANGTWQDVGSQLSGSGPTWTPQGIDLSSFAGQTVRVGFLLSSNIGVSLAGLYIDDVEITTN